MSSDLGSDILTLVWALQVNFEDAHILCRNFDPKLLALILVFDRENLPQIHRVKSLQMNIVKKVDLLILRLKK